MERQENLRFDRPDQGEGVKRRHESNGHAPQMRCGRTCVNTGPDNDSPEGGLSALYSPREELGVARCPAIADPFSLDS